MELTQNNLQALLKQNLGSSPKLKVYKATDSLKKEWWLKSRKVAVFISKFLITLSTARCFCCG
jgi:hypothetical protein